MALAKAFDVAVAPAVIERRRAHRSQVRREAWLRGRDGMIHGVVIIDISSSGAGLVPLGSSALDAGDRVDLAIELDPPKDDVWIPSVVRWRAGGRIGVAFSGARPSLIARVLRICT